jgi:hypothetical protein
MCAVKDDQSVVIDREPDQDKSHEPSGPRIRCPLCGWSPRKEDRWSCDRFQLLVFERKGVLSSFRLDHTALSVLPFLR